MKLKKDIANSSLFYCIFLCSGHFIYFVWLIDILFILPLQIIHEAY